MTKTKRAVLHLASSSSKHIDNNLSGIEIEREYDYFCNKLKGGNNLAMCKLALILNTKTVFPEGKNVLQNREMHLQAAILVAAWGR